jgi:hypothetical protein
LSAFTDELSAKNGHRAGFKAMWKQPEAHRFDCLLFWSLDRLTREGTFARLQSLRRLSDLGIKFKSFSTWILWASLAKRSSAFLRQWRSKKESDSASAPRQG